MDREIRFRAWDATHKRFDNIVAGNLLYQLHDTENENIDVEYGTRFFLQQYTGLKDKNWKEIYEGDLVKIDRYKEPLIGEVNQLKGGQYYIDHKKVDLKYRHQIHSEIRDFDLPAFFLDFFEAHELEVIGNSFEHPHLLEGSTNGK